MRLEPRYVFCKNNDKIELFYYNKAQNGGVPLKLELKQELERSESQADFDVFLRETFERSLEKPKIIQLSDNDFKRITLFAGHTPKNDPAESFLKTSSQQRRFMVEMVPLASLNHLLTDVKQTFSSQFITTLEQDFSDPDDASVAASILDSYEPCPCASGKQYKACCKNIFVEITCAMTSAEDGNYTEALSWIEKARSIVGTTPEIMCREAIVSSFFDEKKSNTLLETCLKQYPNYPRAHYIHGICLTEQSDLTGAIEAYKAAIRLYPETDHYHLNEAYNNLGILYYNMNDRENAALAWQKAVVYMPSDSVARDNLALVQGYGAKRGVTCLYYTREL